MNSRIKALSSLDTSSNKIMIESAIELSKNGRYVDVYRCIESCARSNKEVPFDVYMELFDRVIETGNESNVRKVGEYILENAIHKTRDAKHTQQLINRRIGKLKAKLKPKYNITPIKPSTPNYIKEETILDIYENMLNKAYACENYDRVALNYNNISKRFNLESFFVDHSNQTTADTVIELCKLVDTYTMSTGIKFNTVIETAWYGFESLRINYNKKEVLEAAVDYFCFKENGAECCKKIMDTTIFYDKDDKDLEIFMEDEPEEIDNSIDKNITDGINQYCKIQESSNKDNDISKFNKIFNKFKKEELNEDKPADKLKSLITKLYAKNVDGIVEDTPKFLSWIRAFFILGAATIPVVGPVLAAIGFIADKFIALHMEREETKKMLTCFNSEIKKTKEKLDKMDNGDEKDNLKKYLKSLEDARNKIDDYYNQLLTDKEVDSRYEEESSDEYDDDFLDFGDDFDFSDFEEFFVMDTMANKITAFLECDTFITSDDMYNLAKNVNDDAITDIATLASLYPDEFYKDSVQNAILDHIKEINGNAVKCESVVEKILRKDAYENALKVFDKISPIEKPLTIYEANAYLDNILENAMVINTLNRYTKEKMAHNTILEASVINSLRMATMKLKQNISKMSSEEKNISREIDRGANSLMKGVEKALTTGNRESVLKGSIIPSASKIIKIGLVDAGLVAIGQPVLAVIATLGYLGASHFFKNKERQLLIDEIEIELKMCQKYIDLAEANGDMKALKQCLTIQRNLQRQLQRIKYRMKVDLGRKHIDSSYLDNVDDIKVN